MEVFEGLESAGPEDHIEPNRTRYRWVLAQLSQSWNDSKVLISMEFLLQYMALCLDCSIVSRLTR